MHAAAETASAQSHPLSSKRRIRPPISVFSVRSHALCVRGLHYIRPIPTQAGALKEQLRELASLTEFPVVHLPLRALARRHVGQRRHGEPGLTPALQPTAQRMDALVAVRRQAEGGACARRLSGLFAVEDQLAAPRNQVVRMPKRLGGEPVRARDAVRSCLAVQYCSQIDDHEGVTRLHPSLIPSRTNSTLHPLSYIHPQS